MVQLNRSNADPNPDPTPGGRVIRQDLGSFEGIQIFASEMINPAEFLKLMPKTAQGGERVTREEAWLTSVQILGVEHALNHDFQEFHKRLRESDPGLSCTGGLASFAECYLGAFGRRVCAELDDLQVFADEQWKGFKILVTQRIGGEPRENLGSFGRWLEASGVNDSFRAAVISEFLND